MAVKYKTAFNKLKAIWKRTGKVKGKKHAKWGGKRGAFSTIAKAASAESKKAPKKKAPKKAPKKKASKKAPKKKAAKKSVPRAAKKQPSKTEKKVYTVSGKNRQITPYRAKELRDQGKTVKLAKSQKTPRRSRSRGKAGLGILGGLLVTGAVVTGGVLAYKALKKATA